MVLHTLHPASIGHSDLRGAPGRDALLWAPLPTSIPDRPLVLICAGTRRARTPWSPMPVTGKVDTSQQDPQPSERQTAPAGSSNSGAATAERQVQSRMPPSAWQHQSRRPAWPATNRPPPRTIRPAGPWAHKALNTPDGGRNPAEEPTCTCDGSQTPRPPVSAVITSAAARDRTNQFIRKSTGSSQKRFINKTIRRTAPRAPLSP